jgi:hypothetical protein
MLSTTVRSDYLTELHSRFPLLASFQSNPIAATIDYYAGCLAGSPKAIQWAQSVLNLSLSDAQSLQIGFSDRSLGSQLPNKQVQHGRSIREALETLGIYKTNGRESLRGYVTIPLFNDLGDITGIHALRVDAENREDDPVIIGTGEWPPALRTAHVAVTPDTVMPEAVMPVNVIRTPAATAVEPTAVETPATFELTVTSQHIAFTRGDRHYQVHGLERNMSSLTLRVCLQATRQDLIYLDTLDLVKARSRNALIQAIAVELFVEESTVKKDIGILLLQLEDLRNRQIDAVKNQTPSTPELTTEDREHALQWLRSPNLSEQIVNDLDQCGMVGEAFNKLAAYLAVVSRKLTQPLAILIQSSSSAGKTTLMDSVLAMVPPEDQLRLSNLTGQSLYYLDSQAIRHKTLAISEEQGIAEASYALKLLQSEGRLSHATVAKGSDGRMAMQAYHVEGPVQLFLTSTSLEMDEELVNRCLVLSVDETREQTLAIQAQQRLLQTRHSVAFLRQCKDIRHLHQNAQRLLRPLQVYNPFADRLSFASDRTRLRRDHSKYLTLIQSIALLHQYQRPIQVEEVDGKRIESIEVTMEDITLANRLMAEILGRSLDELSPQTRRCLLLLEEYVLDQCQRKDIGQKDYRFSRREFRESIGWSDFQVRMHLSKLVAMEYVLVHHGKQGRSYLYELIYAGQGRDGRPFVLGLAELEAETR